MKWPSIFLVFLLVCASIVLSVFLTAKHFNGIMDSMSASKQDSIDLLLQEADSLRFEVYLLEYNEQELRKKQSVVVVRTIYVTDSVKRLSPSGTVEYFNERTGGGATLNADSTVTAPLPNIIKSNVCFAQLDGERSKNSVLSDRIQNARKEIAKLMVMDTTNQAAITLLNQEAARLAVEGRKKDAALRREKIKKVVAIAAGVLVEIATIIILK